jgi:hypothetical protein
VHEKEIQLQEIARAADRLEKRGVPIPDVLRSEKMRLAADLSTMVARLAALSEKQNAIVDLSTCFNKQSKRNNGTDPILGKQKTARPRGKSPKTHKNELRQYVVLALQRMGGRGQVSQIIAEMGKLLEGKLLPGDLEWRASAKEFAWQNNTRWEYMALKREGILKSDTPTGIWELNGRT